MAPILVLLAALVGAVAGQGYAPAFVPCPISATASILRLAGTPQQGTQRLSNAETDYLAARRALIPASLKTYLGDLSSIVYGGSLAAADPPTIGISISGGGNRAALYGAGVLAALDGRNATAVAQGTGGLLQAASYITGLSGGSWLLSSFLFGNMPTMYNMVLGNRNAPGWLLSRDLFTPGDATTQPVYVANIFDDLTEKSKAGFKVTFNDYWSRALSYHFLPGTDAANFFDNSTENHAAALTLSSAVNLSSYQEHLMPFPILLADVYSVNSHEDPLLGVDVPLQNVVFEMSPLEFGSYDPELAAFIPMELLGTAASKGTPVNGGPAGFCVHGFDNAGFLLGASSNIFNLYNVTNDITWYNPLSPVQAAWTAINQTFFPAQPNQQLDIASVPNPFQGINPGVYEDSGQEQLYLLDGGLNNENNAISPLSVVARAVDVLVVIDGSADTAERKPNGASLIVTQLRSRILPNGTVNLPPLPKNTTTFVEYGLSDRPTFFGCKGTPSKLGRQSAPATYPMIIYLPNTDPTGTTNTTTGQLVYPNAQASKILDTSFALTTRGIPTNGTSDAQWPTCLACAVVERTRGTKGVDRTPACESCFGRYCWDETEWVEEKGKVEGKESGGGRLRASAVMGGLMLVVGLLL